MVTFIENCVNSGEHSQSQSRAKLITRANGNPTKSEQSGHPSDYPQGFFKERLCGVCEGVFSPLTPAEKYCKDECKDVASTDKYFRRTYNISYKEYLGLHEDQEGLCKICRKVGFLMNKERHKLLLVVDHCHATGKVRGLLCHNCNRALGLFKDNQESLEAAISYLKV